MFLEQVPTSSEPRPSRSGVVSRVTSILDSFMRGPDVLLLEDVTSMTGLPRSTVFRILTQLVELQWLQHDAPGYRIGPRAEAYAAPRQSHGPLRAAASATLNELHLATGGVAHLSVLEGSFVRYLDKTGGAEAWTIPSNVDSRTYAWRTVGGRALLAALLTERLDEALALHHDKVEIDSLYRVLSRIRQRKGVSLLDGAKCNLGISGVACPIYGPDGVVAAISVVSRKPLNPTIVTPMVAFAARRTAQLLYPGSPRTSSSASAGTSSRAGLATGS